MGSGRVEKEGWKVPEVNVFPLRFFPLAPPRDLGSDLKRSGHASDRHVTTPHEARLPLGVTRGKAI